MRHEHYAAALGVDHYFRGLTPISFRALLDATEEACRGMDDEVPIGPTPLDPGGKSDPDTHRSEVERLADYLERHFPGEPGSQGPPEGETAVDVAVRLLEQLSAMRLDMGSIGARISAEFPEAEPPKRFGSSLGLGEAVPRLLDELVAARKLARETISLVRDATQNERKACADYIRRWPQTSPEALAHGISRGVHRLSDSSDPEPFV